MEVHTIHTYIQILPSQLPCKEHEVEAHKERLGNNASAWNFSIVPVPADGNCFFTAAALALVQDIATSKPILNCIAGVNVYTNGSIVALAARLRELVVTEWLGPYSLDFN